MPGNEPFGTNSFGGAYLPVNQPTSQTSQPTSPQVTNSPQLQPSQNKTFSKTEIQVLDNNLNLLAKVTNPYPLDKSGNILRYSKELDDFGQATFRISTYDSFHTNFGDILIPHKNWIRLVRGGQTVWQGAIIDNPKRNKQFIEVTAAEPMWYFSKIFVNRTSNNPATGAADSIYRIFNSGTMSAAVTAVMTETIANFSGNHALANMTLGTITNPSYPPNMTDGNNPPNKLSGPWNFGNGTAAPQLQFDFHTIMYVLKSFGVYAYADFYLDNSLVFNFVPFKGSNKSTQVSFVWGGPNNLVTNIIDYNLPRLGERMVNELYGIAVDPNGLMLHYSQTDQASVTANGLLQGVAAYADVKDQATLNARIAAEIPLISTPDSAAITVILDENAYPLGLYDVGDIVNINIQSSSTSFQDNRRVVGITCVLHNTGRESIAVQTNKVLPFQFALAPGQNYTAVTT